MILVGSERSTSATTTRVFSENQYRDIFLCGFSEVPLYNILRIGNILSEILS